MRVDVFVGQKVIQLIGSFYLGLASESIGRSRVEYRQASVARVAESSRDFSPPPKKF